MRTRAAVVFLLSAVVGLTAATAHAQYPVNGPADPATGEKYHVELGGFLWDPNPQIVISSESLGIVGSQIDFVNDLGIQKTWFKQFRSSSVPRRSTSSGSNTHRSPTMRSARCQPRSSSTGSSFRSRSRSRPTCSGKRTGSATNTTSSVADRGYVGLILESKYTDIQATLSNIIGAEFTRARAPIPAAGVVGRVYVVPNISITGEFTGIKWPESINDRYRAKYFRLQLLRHGELHQQLRRPGGIPIVRCRVQDQRRRGRSAAERPYLGGLVRF